MIFEFNGRKFRIGFRHEPSPRWEDHVFHPVHLRRQERATYNPNGKAAERLFTRAELGVPQIGPAVLWCTKCDLQLSGLAPGQRRNTHCFISIEEADLEADPPYATWVLWSQGRSRRSRRDSYDREQGRLSSLADALHRAVQPERTREFRAALWQWYRAGHHSVVSQRNAATHEFEEGEELPPPPS